MQTAKFTEVQLLILKCRAGLSLLTGRLLALLNAAPPQQVPDVGGERHLLLGRGQVLKQEEKLIISLSDHLVMQTTFKTKVELICF